MVKSGYSEIRIRGQNISVPSVRIGNLTVIRVGKWPKTALVFDEELVQEADLSDPDRLIAQLNKTSNL